MNDVENRLFLLPVRRRLAVLVGSWLSGIYAAQVFSAPAAAAALFCALFLSAAWYLLRRRRSALLFFSLSMLLAGNAYAGCLLAIRDEPTPPQTQMSGVVCAIESDFRVTLRNVRTVGCSAPARRVMVTLMLEKEEAREPVRVGQVVSGTGRLFAPDEPRNPGGIDWRIRALGKGYELSGYILPGWTAEGDAVFSVTEAFRQLRLHLMAVIERVFGDRASLFQGVMLGGRDVMEQELVTAMQMTGTVHILTVSGLHMSMIAAAVAFLLRPFPLGRYLNLLIQTALLIFFVLLTGGAAGTQRAMVMATLRALAACRGRRYEPVTALCTAALIMTVINPLIALNVSFQFSFFVVFGIQMIGKNADAWLRRHAYDHAAIYGALRSGMMALAAQLSAIPMNLLLYGYVPLLSLPMNLVCSALLPIVMIGGWACTLAECLLPGWGIWAAALPRAAAGLFEIVSLYAGSLEGAILRLPAPYAFTMIPVIALMLFASARIRYGGRRRMAALAAAVVIAMLYLPRFSPAARYVQVDVGQGDGAILRSGRRAVLIDIGPEDSYDVLRYLRHEGLLVDAVILSHLDRDHAGALESLLNAEVDVPCIVLGERAAMQGEDSPVLEVIDQAEGNGVPIYCVSSGEAICIPWMTADVYIAGEEHLGSNEQSMLLRILIAGRSILTAGDLPIECEPTVVPDCDVLKVAHHGSRYATSPAFLSMAKPEIALISVGAGNGYGHPTDRVLHDLDKAGAAVYRTDQSGCITIWLEDGLRVETFE